MPSIPTYTSQRNITSNPGAPLRNEVDNQANNNLLNTVNQISQQWSAANDVMQYTDASAKYGVAAADIQARAEADPDFNNTEKYVKELEKAKADSLKGIANQQIANKAAAEFNLNNQVAAFKIGNQFRQKQIVHSKVQLKTNIDIEQNKKLSTSSDIEKAKSDAKIKGLIEASIASGVLDAAEADKMLREAQTDSVKFDIYADQATDEKDSQVLKELKDPNGKYSFLPPDERLSLIKQSQDRIFNNNQTFKREVEVSQDHRTNEFILKMAEGTATFKDIDSEYAIPEEKGGMPRTILDQYQRRLQRGVESDLNQILQEKDTDKDPTKRAKLAKEYNDLIEYYLDDKTDQWKAKEALAKGLADGLIDPQEQKILYPLKNSLKDIQFNRSTSPVDWAIKSVKEMMGASNASDEEIAIRIKQLVNGIGEGKSPQQMSGEIMSQEMLKNFPDIESYPEKGVEYLNEDGRKYIVFPNKTWKWADGKTTK